MTLFFNSFNKPPLTRTCRCGGLVFGNKQGMLPDLKELTEEREKQRGLPELTHPQVSHLWKYMLMTFAIAAKSFLNQLWAKQKCHLIISELHLNSFLIKNGIIQQDQLDMAFGFLKMQNILQRQGFTPPTKYVQKNML